MDTNWLALAVAAVSTLVAGFVWYNPKVFGKAWMEASGMTEEKAQQGNMLLTFGLSLVLAFVAAIFISSMVAHGGEEFTTFKHGAFHGMFLGLMVAAPVIITNALFEQKSWKYMAINAGYWLLNFVIMGGIISMWR
ncbi:MAG: DUF1761 domain-containing protein [Bacteroidetes bacterium]|nr:MAG: DUF1761 domain-containing protein [Bacteroidota bacterium]